MRNRKLIIGYLLVALAVWAANAATGVSYQMQLGNPSNATSDTNNHSHYLIQRSVLAEDYNVCV